MSEVIDRAKDAIAAAAPEELCRTRKVNVFELSGIHSILRSVSNFRGHTQEIIRQTRELLGEKYQFAGPR
jgi:hypothetical protein